MPSSRLILCLSSLAVFSACTSVPASREHETPAAHAHLASDQLVTFGSSREFRHWLRETYRAAQAEGLRWDGEFEDSSKQDQATAETDQDICEEDDDACDTEERIVVTGSRISAPTPALSAVQITNTQESQVDEGDIIKQLGDYLIILHDGRLSSASLRPGGQDGLELIDRIDVYTDPARRIWYDEILVVDGRIMVTAYSYQDEATEFTIFSMDADGRFTRDARFLLTSDDYWSGDNYATRIIGNQLVMYTPTFIDSVEDLSAVPLPNLRNVPFDSREDFTATDETPRLIDYRDLYRPLQVELMPAIHAVTRCDIRPAGEEDAASCDTTAFLGGSVREFYVTTDFVFVWSTPFWRHYQIDYRNRPDLCTARQDWQDAVEGVIHRVDITSGELSAVRVNGFPDDQYAISRSGDQLHAILAHHQSTCTARPDQNSLFYMSLPLSRFSSRDISRPLDAFTNLPSLPGLRGAQYRFTADHAVVISREAWPNTPPDDGERYQNSLALSFPINAPEQVSITRLDFAAGRLETLGETLFTTGYSDRRGLRLAQLDPRHGIRVTHSGILKDRIESEGRSHAFNLTRLDDETLLLGLPTIGRDEDTRPNWWWYQDNSDVSFIRLGQSDGFTYAGDLNADPENVHPDYDCDVSCIDWYGNSRPIFTFGRIFALSGTEIIEGEFENGHVGEVRRINLTAPVSRLSDP